MDMNCVDMDVGVDMGVDMLGVVLLLYFLFIWFLYYLCYVSGLGCKRVQEVKVKKSAQMLILLLQVYFI